MEFVCVIDERTRQPQLNSGVSDPDNDQRERLQSVWLLIPSCQIHSCAMRVTCLSACFCFRPLVFSTKGFWPFRGSSQSPGRSTQSVNAATSGFLLHLYYWLSEFPSLLSGRCRLSPHAAVSLRPLVPCRVLRLCVGAGGSVSAQHPIRWLHDGHRHRSPDRTVRLLRPSFQTHVHARRWRSRSGKKTKKTHSQTLAHTHNHCCILFIFLIWTFLAVKLLSALVGVAQDLNAGAENSQKLYDVQKAKTLRQKSAAQRKKMQKKITEVRPACRRFKKKKNWTKFKLV